MFHTSNLIFWYIWILNLFIKLFYLYKNIQATIHILDIYGKMSSVLDNALILNNIESSFAFFCGCRCCVLSAATEFLGVFHQFQSDIDAVITERKKKESGKSVTKKRGARPLDRNSRPCGYNAKKEN